MRYTGRFDSIDGRAYRIEIATETAGGDRELKLSGRPFVASVKGDGKMLYSPVRCGGATVGILSEDYIFDLYSGQAKGVRVTLYEETDGGDVTRWTGYVTPTIYDQGYDQWMEGIELDCVDGVAVLKDIPFRAEEKGIRTFLDILTHCLRESGCYRAFYISDNVQLKAGGEEALAEKLRVSVSNFFEERKDMAQTDDDIAWSCYDVMKELLQWLGYTLTVAGDEVYILDYDAIAAGVATYHRYSLEDGGRSYVKAGAKKEIRGEDYASSGSRVSLEEVYNKVTVKDSFHTYDNLFPTFGDENFETNLTAPDDKPLAADAAVSAVIRFADVLTPVDYSKVINENFVVVEDKSPRSGSVCYSFMKFMDSPVFTFHKYQRNSGRADITADQSLWGKGNFKYSSMLGHNGGFYLRYFQLSDHTAGKLEGLKSDWSWTEGDSDVRLERIMDCLSIGINPSTIKMSSVIVLLNTGAYRFGPVDEEHYNDTSDEWGDVTTKYPFVTLKDQESSSIFGGRNHFIRIKGKISYHAEPETPHPLYDESADSIDRGQDKKFCDEGYIWCKVKWGERWWDGYDWSETECWFKLRFWDTDGWKIKNRDQYAKEFDIQSNMINSYEFWGEEGYIIKAPAFGNLEGTPEVAFATRDMKGDSRKSHWHPSGTKTDNFYCRFFSEVVIIKDLSITAEVSPGLLSEADLDSDTCYTNVIDNGSVSAMEDIEFKVCTDDGKKPSYSSVDVLEGSQSRFVTVTYNKALQARERGTEGADGLSDGGLRQEEHMVFKTASHYEKPRVVFECCLHNEDYMPFTLFSDDSFGQRKFILTEIETDYRFNSSSLKITEKE